LNPHPTFLMAILTPDKEWS